MIVALPGLFSYFFGSRQHGDLELLKLFRFDVQDDHDGDHLRILQTTSPHKLYVGLS